MSDWRSLADPEVLRQRARLLAAIRAFLDQRGVVEVQTPVITASGITDLHIDSIALGNQAGYLRNLSGIRSQAITGLGHGGYLRARAGVFVPANRDSCTAPSSVCWSGTGVTGAGGNSLRK